MSSPSNVVVVITHLPMHMEEFSLLATEFYQKWRPTAEESEGRLWYADRVLDSFWHHACTGKGFVEGAEGETFTFGNAGNHVNIDTFLDGIEPFIRELVWRHVYTSATIMYQPHDCGFTWYKLDAAGLASKAPNLKLRKQKKFESYPFMSFDVDISSVYTNAIKDPVQGPVQPMTPEQAKNIQDLTNALQAGYGGMPLAELTKGQVLNVESLDHAITKVSFLYTGERRQNCKFCKDGHGLKCAFDADGLFMADNYQCGTLLALRTLADETFYKRPPASLTWSNDQACALIPFEGRFITLGWYKQRGRTEIAQVIEEQHIQCLTRDIAEKVIEFYKNQNLETL